MTGKKGRSGAPGVSRLGGPGASPKGARIEIGSHIFVSETVEGNYTDLGRGTVTQVIRSGTDRILVVTRKDGSEIRIMVVGS